MTDRDVIEHAAALLGAKSKVASYQRDAIERGRPRQRQWYFNLFGNRAAGWMMTLYPLLGVRRRVKIREVLAVWRSYIAHQRDREFCKNGHALIGDNVLTAQWTDAKGVVHKKARRCRTCHNAYHRKWAASKPGYQSEEARNRRRKKAEHEGRVFKPRDRRSSIP